MGFSRKTLAMIRCDHKTTNILCPLPEFDLQACAQGTNCLTSTLTSLLIVVIIYTEKWLQSIKHLQEFGPKLMVNFIPPAHCKFSAGWIFLFSYINNDSSCWVNVPVRFRVEDKQDRLLINFILRVSEVRVRQVIVEEGNFFLLCWYSNSWTNSQSFKYKIKPPL